MWGYLRKRGVKDGSKDLDYLEGWSYCLLRCRRWQEEQLVCVVGWEVGGKEQSSNLDL